MNFITSLDDLKFVKKNPRQHWFYVILANASDPTKAASIILKNLDMFDLDTGYYCDYFLPGFICGHQGPVSETYLSSRYYSDVNKVYLERLGTVPFSGREFVNFYTSLESQVNHRWRYSGRCELLIFDFNKASGLVNLEDFYSYDLDDIIVNGRSISEFIRGMIMISQDEHDKETSKRILDEIYYDMVMPQQGQCNDEYMHACVRAFNNSGFGQIKYCFISYSTKDFIFVKRVHDLLIQNKINCWMAPFDIPRGTSYPYIIEQAIQNASLYLLFLSKQSVRSVWVEKELLRAISKFQFDSPEKICIAWCNGEFSLSGTAFALPLENIQIKVDLKNNPNNWNMFGTAFQDIKRVYASIRDSDLLETCDSEIYGQVDDSPITTRLKSFPNIPPLNNLRNPYKTSLFFSKRYIERIRQINKSNNYFILDIIKNMYSYLSDIRQELIMLNELHDTKSLLSEIDIAIGRLDIIVSKEHLLQTGECPRNFVRETQNSIGIAINTLYDCQDFFYSII